MDAGEATAAEQAEGGSAEGIYSRPGGSPVVVARGSPEGRHLEALVRPEEEVQEVEVAAAGRV